MFTCSSPIIPLCFRYPATHPQSHLAQITPVIQQSPEEPGRERTNFIMLADEDEDGTEDTNKLTFNIGEKFFFQWDQSHVYL